MLPSSGLGIIDWDSLARNISKVTSIPSEPFGFLFAPDNVSMALDVTSLTLLSRLDLAGVAGIIFWLRLKSLLRPRRLS